MKRSLVALAPALFALSSSAFVIGCGSDDAAPAGATPGAGGAVGTGGTSGGGATTGKGGASGAGAKGGAGGKAQGGATGTGGASGAGATTGTGGGGTSGGGATGTGGAAGKGAAGAAGKGQGGSSSDPLDPSLAPPLDENPASYPSNVWITDGMAKTQPSAAPGAVHWAKLHAAKNESESFQVHVKATAAPVQLTVTVSDLVDAKSGTTIAAKSNVTVFREAYLDITTLSDLNGTLGMTPDPLIPAVDPYFHEARNAFPVSVPAGETRSAWVDVLVPQNAPSGYYTGTVTVTDGATKLATLPVQLAVWDFAIPSTSTLRSGFGLGWNSLCVQAYGGYAQCGAYPGASSPDDAIEKTHIAEATLFLDYRVSLGDVVYAPVTDGNYMHFDSLYGPLLDGTAATRLPGAKLTGIWYAGDKAKASQLSSWQSHFASKPAWTALSAAYYCDEPPNGCSYAAALSEAQAIHAAAPGLPTLLTTDYDHASQNGLLDAVDVLVSIIEEMEPRGKPSNRPLYDSWLQKPGKHVWWYQSCDEHESCSNGTPGPAESTWPSYMVDATPARNRVFQWLAYLDRIEGELYYASDYCWTASDCGDAKSGKTTDPWVSIYAFGGNGDGTLYYPGTKAKIGGTTPIPVPSMRLALLRDGMEDFEYLHALDVAGDGAFATTTAKGFITDATTFSNDPTKMQAARLALGDRLHKKAHPLAPLGANAGRVGKKALGTRCPCTGRVRGAVRGDRRTARSLEPRAPLPAPPSPHEPAHGTEHAHGLRAPTSAGARNRSLTDRRGA